VGIKDDCVIRIAVTYKPAIGGVSGVAPVNADKLEVWRIAHCHELRMFDGAGDAPGSENIDEADMAFEVFRRNDAVALQGFEGEIWEGFFNQLRRARV